MQNTNILSYIENSFEKLYMNPVPVPYSIENLSELIEKFPNDSIQLSINYGKRIALQNLEKQIFNK